MHKCRVRKFTQPITETLMNKRLVSVLVIGAVLGLAIGFSVNKFADKSLFLDWITRRTWQDALAWLIGGTAVSYAVTVLKGKA
jgi:hypothetical protein